MGRVANSHGSIYNGVSQQPPHMRSPSQCEEMYNINTSLEYGLIRRSPLEQPDGTIGTIPVMSNAAPETFSKMIIDGNSIYQINIANGSPYIVQLEPYHKIINPGDPEFTLNSDAAWYLKQRGVKYRSGQYATTTIKNTTLISNDAVIPESTEVNAPGGDIGEYALVWLKTADPAMGVQYSITVNGTTFTTTRKNRGSNNKSTLNPSYSSGNSSLDLIFPAPAPVYDYNRGSIYDGETKLQHRPGTGEIVYYSAAASYLNKGFLWLTAAEISGYQTHRQLVNARAVGLKELERARDRRNRLESLQGKLDAWINQDISHPKNTKDAVVELTVALRAANYYVSHYGSMMVIGKGKRSPITTISTFDTLANTAMMAFHGDIDGIEQLPANIYTHWTYLRFRIKQATTSDKATFYIRWTGKIWEESTNNNLTKITQKTMPLEMRIGFNASGSIATVDIDIKDWDDRKTGDLITNKGPKFFNKKPIRDIFFYRNRIGFLTDEGITMTESGEYSNLWRTTTLAVLDSDPIDFIISTNSSTSLRYTVMNQDKIFVFADNVQFVMDGGQILSPKSVKVNEVSHYILNLDVEPITTDNKIIMIGKTETSSIVYEYAYDSNYGIANATAITSHIPGYIMNDVKSLAASNEDNMIFLVATDYKEQLLPYHGRTVFRDVLSNGEYPDHKIDHSAAYPDRNIVYVYKYAESGGKRVQSAWSKWNYRGSVLQISAARGFLYLDIDHEFQGEQIGTVIGTGVWEMSGAWDHEKMVWLMDPSDILDTIILQRRMARQSLKPTYLDAVTGEYIQRDTVLGLESEVIIDYKDFNEYINRSYVDLGEFVFKDRASKTYTAGHSNLSAINIKSDPGSLHNIIVRDLARGREREITPLNNKRFQGIGLAANYFALKMGDAQLVGSGKKTGVGFDSSPILDTTAKETPLRGELSIPNNSFDGPFDVAQIANLDGLDVIPVNPEMPNLYGVDVPVLVGGRSDSTRVIISSFYDGNKDHGFRIHDIIQEAEISTRFSLS